MEIDKISPQDVMNSLSVEYNRRMVFKAGQGAGLSGSFFFFSHDNKFLIKTINKKEMQLLLKMLDNLIEHFKMTDNKSLIARIYGVFTIKTNLFASLDVMIMQNTCLLKNKLNNKITFDIKGSTTNRYT